MSHFKSQRKSIKNRSSREAIQSPILKTDEHAKLYAEWNAKLEAEGLRILDNEYRGMTEYTTKREVKGEALGNAGFEYYDVFRDYCRYTHYELSIVSIMPDNQREPFKRMLVLFVNGDTMPDAYKSIKALWPKPIFTAVYFYKRFQDAKTEFKKVFGLFSQYLYYRKNELNEPLSFFAWQSKHGLLKQ